MLALVLSVFLSIYAAAAVMLAVFIYILKDRRIKSYALDTPGIKFLWALCILGIVVSLVYSNYIGALITFLVAVLFLVGAYIRSVMTRMLLDKILFTACAASLFSFLVAVLQYFLNFDSSYRSCSVFLNANYYATIIEIIVVFAVYKLSRIQSRKNNVFYISVLIANSVGLYLSGCRTAVFVLILAVTVMLLLTCRYKVFAVFLGCSAAVAAIVYFMPELLPRMSDLSADISTRIGIWKKAIEGITNHPIFGEGILAFKSFGYLYKDNIIVHSHNIYLELLLSFGIAGVAFICVYVVKNLRPIWQMRTVNSDRGRFALAVGLFVSAAIHGAVDLTAFSFQTGILYLIALAIAGIQENHRVVMLRVADHVYYLHKPGASLKRRLAVSLEKKSSSYKETG